MADNSLPLDAAKRLLELKKKLLAGSRSSEKLETVSEPAKTAAVETAVASSASAAPAAPVKKQPLTMKSLMSSRRSSRRESEEGLQKQPPEPEITPVGQPPAFVSRLKEAPAHRNADGSKPKVISLTKTFVTTTQEREARQAEEEIAAEKKQMKRPKFATLVRPETQVKIFQRSDGLDVFVKEHKDWLQGVIDSISGLTNESLVIRHDRSDTALFFNQHRQFIKSI
jgi:hypothetical protein